jgi:anthranilate synthase component 2
VILLIDNYDSFTYNLYQYLCELGATVKVVRNDAITVPGIRRLKPEAIVISPGPGHPGEAGVTLAAIRELGPELPILGVCLGHQAIGEAFGAKVVRAKKLMHGKTSLIKHKGVGVFKGLPSPLEVTRYHSLVVERRTLPKALVVTAATADGVIMGVRHRRYAVEGVQFHPESYVTQHGKDMLANFLRSLGRRKSKGIK